MDTTKEPIPKKIENDGLVNAIVSIKFKTHYNEEFFDLKLNEYLTSHYDDWQRIDAPNAGKIINGIPVPVRFFANQKYKIQLTDSKLAFNFTNRYTGWNDYKPLIEEVCTLLKDDLVMDTIEINYISVFKNTKIFDFLDGIIKLNNLPLFYGTQYNFKCQVKNEKNYEATAILSLTNEAPIPNSYTGGEQNTQSIVNITIFGKTAENMMDYLEFLHNTEKDLFYRIVNQEFVDLHNPIY